MGEAGLSSRCAHYDVAIVGASIAGCAAAVLLARRGASVALVERAPDPDAYKVLCTHFIQPSATPTIERLGLRRPLEEAGGVRNRIELWTRFGWVRDGGADGRRHGYNIPRQRLDPLLRRIAAGTDGVDLLLGHAARELLWSGRRVAGVVTGDGRGGSRILRARLVVAADGRRSRVAGLAGLPARVRSVERFAYFAYYGGVELASAGQSQMWMLEPDVAYAFPNGDATVLCYMGSRDKLGEFKTDLGRNLARVFEALPDGPDLARAQRASKVVGTVELANVRRPVHRPGLALIGDAATTSDPLWGVGCGWALQSAEWLADATAGTVGRSPAELDRALRGYARRYRRAIAGHQLQIAGSGGVRSLDPLARLMLAAGAVDERTADLLHDFGARTIPARGLISPRALARALRVDASLRLRGTRIGGAA